MENNQEKKKREVVARVRKYHGTTDPSPFYEITIMKNLKAGQKITLDSTSNEIIK